MTSIRNLPLAVRLGGAFGALCLALVIVALTGVNAMSGLKSETNELAEHDLRAAELLGGMQERAKDNLSLIGQHLYVADGDVEAQDALANEIEANWAESKKDGGELEELFAGTPAAEEYTAFTAQRAEVLETPTRTASRASRTASTRSRPAT